MNEINLRKIGYTIIIGVIVVFAVLFGFSDKKAVAPTQTTQAPAASVRYQGVEGKTALELLKASHNVETKQFSFGEMVISIDGVTPDPNKAFWAFYVNGKMSDVGASTYVTKSSDVIEWKLEEIKM
jgi:hypothetical protein